VSDEPETLPATCGECKHARVRSAVCDQTLGVDCLDCNTNIAVCWMDDHIPESLWNRVCDCGYDPGAKRCEQNRDDVCALCGEKIVTK
jgi:hypothetical protein